MLQRREGVLAALYGTIDRVLHERTRMFKRYHVAYVASPTGCRGAAGPCQRSELAMKSRGSD